MNLQKAKILLEKINSLHKSMSVDAGNIANIEKDLMRDYIRQLYDAYSGETPSIVPEQAKVEIFKSTPKPRRKPKPAPKPVELEVFHADEPEEIEAPQPTPTPRPKPKPRVIALPDSLKEIAAETPPPAPKPTPPPPPPPPAPKPKPARKPVVVADEEVEELFEHSTSTDLSEMLSNAPIKDLRKSMGLNEKIFTINELFGGDQGAFDSSLLMLNSFDSFDQAQAYLMENIVGKFGWTKRNKKKKAKNFIKLVRRRYN